MRDQKTSQSYWPIAIISFFAVAIIGMVAFITWVVRQRMDLVQKDYYAEEIRFQEHIDRVNRTGKLSGETKIAYDVSTEVVTISLPATHVGQQPDGFIHFYRPSDASQDKRVKLSLSADGTQRLDARKLQTGLWKVRLLWKINGDEFYADQSIVVGIAHL